MVSYFLTIWNSRSKYQSYQIVTNQSNFKNIKNDSSLEIDFWNASSISFLINLSLIYLIKIPQICKKIYAILGSR